MLARDVFTEVSLAQLMAATDWQSKYRLLVQWGLLITPKPSLRVQAFFLPGCETPAWLSHEIENGCHYFYFDSDSRIINGLVGLVLAQLQGKASSEVALSDLQHLLLDAGLKKHLSASRNNGFAVILSKISSFYAP